MLDATGTDRRRLRTLLVMLATFAALALGGCGDDGPAGADGAQGPTGPTGPTGLEGGPHPVSFLVLASEFIDQAATDIAVAIYGEGGFVSGSSVDVLNADSSTPVMADLAGYDVVLAGTDVSPADPAALGDLLADYVDAGGRLVMIQACWTSSWGVQGRILTTGYSPFQAGPGAGDATDRVFDTTTIALPPHPVLTGINTTTWASPSFGTMTACPLDTGATLVASFTNGHSAIAMNADGTILALNVTLSGSNTTNEPTAKLIANGILYMAGEL